MNRIGFIGGSDMRRIMEGTDITLKETGRKKPDDLSDVLPVQLGSFTEQFNINWFQQQTGKQVLPASMIKLDVDGIPCKGCLTVCRGHHTNRVQAHLRQQHRQCTQAVHATDPVLHVGRQLHRMLSVSPVWQQTLGVSACISCR